ncbi:MAG: M28 family metallopeptidase [Oscillospiraceae bacterium]|nr:M28 family metallopeptidase [Oscillospiraceae bacterium]
MARVKVDRAAARIEASPATVQYMMDGVRHVCETFKNRLPGSQPERDAQAFFKGELEGFADEVTMEDFTLHPHAFMGFIPMAAVFMLGTVAIYLFGGTSVLLALLGAALSVFSVLMFIFEFLFYREFVDFLFPKRVSRNVYAVRRAAGEVRRRVIFGGHTDAANEWTYSWLGEATALAIAMVGAILSMFIGLFAGIVNAVYVIAVNVTGGAPASRWEGGWLVWTIMLLCTIPFAFAIMKFINYKIVVEGANDNLSANYVAIAVLKEMAESGMRFENTEVGCLLTGSEEAGLRGARAYAKAHFAELNDPNIETIFIGLETLREIEEMRVNSIGCTGTVRNDKAVGELIRDAGRACGVEIPDTELYPGAMDSEAWTQLGLRANAFGGVSHEAKRYYHTRKDTPDNMDADCLALSLNICKEAARLFDKEGMAKYDAA